MKKLLAIGCLLFIGIASKAQQPLKTSFIHIDQFGYLPSSKKVAVISNPIVGFDSDLAFNPSLGLNKYEVRRAVDGTSVFAGTITKWNNGIVDTTSGDKAWWFDFSAVSIPGEYYIVDVGKNVASYNFNIDENAYNDVLKAAVRMFFYNRCGANKTVQNAGANWADGPSFVGPRQDGNARSVYQPNDASTEKDLRGGWWDAGDYNKYTTFASSAVHLLLSSYRDNPSIWKDDYNIPESGNSIPDILDEVKWELDFLKKMQQADGSSLIKMGNKFGDFDQPSPPSTDERFRYYYPGGCTSATIANCAMFAHAAYIFKNFPTLKPYSKDLAKRAIKAWDNYASIPDKQTDCDDGTILAGVADVSEEGQFEMQVMSGVYLFATTGKVKYKNFVDQNYQQLKVIDQYWWGPYNVEIGESLLFYSSLPNATPAIAADIRQAKKDRNYTDFYKFSAGVDKDPYRSYVDYFMYHWGSFMPRCNVGNINYEFLTYNIDETNFEDYSQKAEETMHYIHGVNPLNKVYLSNMYSYGAENCVNEFYHSWFADGTAYDNVFESEYGPAPGFMPGGPCKFYAEDANADPNASPPANQPAQKSYLETNGDDPSAIYIIMEAGIYYQAAYVKLLSKFVGNGTNTTEIAETSLDQEDKIEFKNFIYPNPVSDFLQLTKGEPVFYYEIFDLNGKLVKNGKNVSILEVKTLPNGEYILKTYNGAMQVLLNNKFIKI